MDFSISGSSSSSSSSRSSTQIKGQWPLAKYTRAVLDLLAAATGPVKSNRTQSDRPVNSHRAPQSTDTSMGYSSDDFIWMESVPFPLRNDLAVNQVRLLTPLHSIPAFPSLPPSLPSLSACIPITPHLSCHQIIIHLTHFIIFHLLLLSSPPLLAMFIINQSGDWRTLHRILLYNQVATHLARSHHLRILPTDSLLPLVDKMCDNAHYSAKGALMPMIQAYLAMLPRPQSNHPVKYL